MCARLESFTLLQTLQERRSWRVGRDVMVPYSVSLKSKEGSVEEGDNNLLKAYYVPQYATMTAAVHAFVETKFDAAGCYRGGAQQSAWREPEQFSPQIAAPCEEAIPAPIACGEYV